MQLSTIRLDSDHGWVSINPEHIIAVFIPVEEPTVPMSIELTGGITLEIAAGSESYMLMEKLLRISNAN